MTKRRYAGVEETRQQLPALLDAARAGKPVVITKYGKPYAAIVRLESLPEAGPRPSLRALRGTVAGLWGDDAAAWVDRLRSSPATVRCVGCADNGSSDRSDRGVP